MSNLQDDIMKLAGTYLKDIVSIMPCNVDSVDQDNRVCDCTPIGGDAATQIPSVQLCAENDDGFLVFPKIGSTVIVGLSTRNTAFVIMYSGVSNIQMLDGSLGGLAVTGVLAAKYNILETFANQLITAVIAINSAASGSPAAPVTNATLAAFLATIIPTLKTLTTQAEIENNLITQGI